PFGSFGGASSIEAFARQARMSVEEFIAAVPTATRLRSRSHLTPAEQRTVRKAASASTEIRGHLLTIGARNRTTVLGYMQQEINFTESLAIVEYWGRGCTQDCLATIWRAGRLIDTPLPFYYARSIYDSDGVSLRHNFTSSAFSMLVPETLFANLDYGTTE